MPTKPKVVHFHTTPCGSIFLNLLTTTNPGEVTCRACVASMTNTSPKEARNKRRVNPIQE